MEYHDNVIKLFTVLIILYLHLPTNFVSSSRPPIIWDPYHPLFSCNDPLINVKQDDLLKFICPTQDLSANPTATEKTLFEKALFLDYTQLDDYNNCNATVHKTVLIVCEGQFKSQEHFVTKFAPTGTSPTFETGKTYFVVSTSFRYKSNLNNLVGGSCSNTTDGSYQLRLKIHVCTDEEISNGECNLCTSEGCYYKSCGISCSDWETVGVVKRSTQCYHVEKQTCNNTVLQEKKEVYRETLTSCDSPLIVSGAAKGESPNSNDDDSTYLAIGVAALGLLFGIVIGAFSHKKYNSRNCRQESVSPDIESCPKKYNAGPDNTINGKVNNGYEPSRDSLGL